MAPRVGKTLCALQLAIEIDGNILFVTKKAAIGSVEGDSRLMGGLDDRLVVVNYESLHKLKFGGYSTVILDEVHRLSAFPKPCKAARLVRGICAGASQVVMLSGTPAIEANSQWFNIFWATARGPWRDFGNGIMAFYKWFKTYGISEKIKIAGGVEVESYKRVIDRVADEVKPYSICMTQSDVGFNQSAQLVTHLIDGPEILRFGAAMKKNGIEAMECGRVVVAENPAAVLQKCAMACGGTLIDDQGDSFIHDLDDGAKLKFLISKLAEGKQYAIFTQYIAERDYVIEGLRDAGFDAGDDMESFKRGDLMVFVGSIKRYCEGVDLAFINGAMVIYSLTFSGSTFVQILDRMNNFERVDPIKVHVLMIRGSVEESIFEAVSQKKNFNDGFLNA